MSVQKISPMGYIESILHHNDIKDIPKHIEYDQNINSNNRYEVTLSSRHDGTVIFTMSIIEKILVPLLNMQAIQPSALSDEEVNKLKGIHYTIGDMTIESEYGVKVKDFIGVRETVKLPVKFDYIFQ